jgi:hypothetical protein
MSYTQNTFIIQYAQFRTTDICFYYPSAYTAHWIRKLIVKLDVITPMELSTAKNMCNGHSHWNLLLHCPGVPSPPWQEYFQTLDVLKVILVVKKYRSGNTCIINIARRYLFRTATEPSNYVEEQVERAFDSAKIDIRAVKVEVEVRNLACTGKDPTHTACGGGCARLLEEKIPGLIKSE